MNPSAPIRPARVYRAVHRPRFTLWPSRYTVATLAAPPTLPQTLAGSPRFLVIENAAEITLVAPESVFDELETMVVKREDGWRALTLDGDFPLDAVGVLAALSKALAEAGVPVMAFSSYGTDHLMVPEGQLGRALAALAQVWLPASPLRS